MFSFSAMATKICVIFLMVLTLAYIAYVKPLKKIAQILLAFSEKLNFTEYLRSKLRWRFRQILWPSQKTSTLSPPLSYISVSVAYC